MAVTPWLGQEIRTWAQQNLLGNNRQEVEDFGFQVMRLEDQLEDLQAQFTETLNESIRSSGQASAQLVGAILSGRITINDEEVMPDGLT